jgi:hypothetical protein
MKVKPLFNVGPQDFPGGLEVGREYDLTDDLAARLIRNGWAVDANAKPAETQSTVLPFKQKRK